MDGFALCAEDVEADPGDGPIRLRIAGEISAGMASDVRIRPGSCWRIMTGAPLPPGTAVVVPVEWTDAPEGETVTIRRIPVKGSHMRPSGQDARRGDLVIEAGTVLRSAAMGMIATLGIDRVPVRRRPLVAVVTTGNELTEPGGALSPGRIFNSNATALSSQVIEAGGVVLGPFHAGDDPAELDHVIADFAPCDLAVFSGGVSMGRYDLVHDALRRAGFETGFWKVRQRPGSPLLFGQLRGVPVLGLPGNPVSTSVCFDQYARPAMAAMLGRTEIRRPRFKATLARAFQKPAGLHVFARGVADPGSQGGIVIRPTGEQGSNLFTSVLRANCLVHLPAEWDQTHEGQEVEMEWIDW